MRPHIPWLSLRQTCKLITWELKFLTSDKDFDTDRTNHVWEIDASMERGEPIGMEYRIRKRKVERVRLPCQPSAVKDIVFNIELTYDHKVAGLDCNTLEASMRDLWSPRRESVSEMDMSEGILPRPDFREITFNVLDKSVGEVDARKIEIMTSFAELFEFWFKFNYGTGETYFEIVEPRRGEMEVMAKYRFCHKGGT
jgi:hypothetical protein